MRAASILHLRSIVAAFFSALVRADRSHHGGGTVHGGRGSLCRARALARAAPCAAWPPVARDHAHWRPLASRVRRSSNPLRKGLLATRRSLPNTALSIRDLGEPVLLSHRLKAATDRASPQASPRMVLLAVFSTQPVTECLVTAKATRARVRASGGEGGKTDAVQLCSAAARAWRKRASKQLRGVHTLAARHPGVQMRRLPGQTAEQHACAGLA